MRNIRHTTYFDTIENSYNPFDEENSNSRRIMALIQVQTELLKEVLTDRQIDVVNYVVLKQFKIKEAAVILSINESTVSKTLQAAIKKLRQYMHFCDMAIKFYEQLGD